MNDLNLHPVGEHHSSVALAFHCQRVLRDLRFELVESRHGVELLRVLNEEVGDWWVVRGVLRVQPCPIWVHCLECFSKQRVEGLDHVNGAVESCDSKRDHVLHPLNRILRSPRLLQEDRSEAVPVAHPLNEGSRLKYAHWQGNADHALAREYTGRGLLDHILHYALLLLQGFFIGALQTILLGDFELRQDLVYLPRSLLRQKFFVLEVGRRWCVA